MMHPKRSWASKVLTSSHSLSLLVLVTTIVVLAASEADLNEDCQSRKNGLCFGLDQNNQLLTLSGTAQKCQEYCNLVSINHDSLANEFKVRMRSPLQQMNHRNHYFAVGISKDRRMGDDFVVYCRIRKGQPEVGIAKNVGRTNELLDDRASISLGSEKVSVLDKFLHCELILLTGQNALGGDTADQSELSFDLVNKKYVLLAAAGEVRDDDVKTVGQHHFSKALKPTKMSFSSGEEITPDSSDASSDSIVLALHKISMIIAFTFCFPLGTFIGRFYKETWARRRHCGKRRWLIFHVICTAFGAVSACVGAIIMVVGYSKFDIRMLLSPDEPTVKHTISGLIALSLLLYLCTTNWWKPSTPGSTRHVLGFIHSLLGFMCYFTGSLNLFISTWWTRASLAPCAEKQAIVVFSFVLFVIVCLCMSVCIAWTDWHLDIIGYRSLLKFPLAIVSDEEAPRPKLRKAVLLSYICLSGLVSIVCIVLHLLMNLDCQF